MTRRFAEVGILFLLVCSAGLVPSIAGWESVGVEVQLPPELETEPGERVLVARVRANDHPMFDIGLEITRWMRSELRRRTSLSVVDGTPPPIPEQRPEQLAANDRFWRRLGEDFDAPLVIGAICNFVTEDRSGYVSRDQINPRTGQTTRNLVFSEQEGFTLQLEVFFFKGDNGSLLHTDFWQYEVILAEDQAREDLHVLFALLETMRDDLEAVLLPTSIRQPRFIWAE